MSTPASTAPITHPAFGDLIHGYFAEDAIADGASHLLDPRLTAEVRLNVPLVLTNAVHADAVAWDRDEAINTADARGRDLLLVMRRAALQAVETNEPVGFSLARVPNKTRSGALSQAEIATTVDLVVRVEYFNATGRPCLVVSQRDEV